MNSFLIYKNLIVKKKNKYDSSWPKVFKWQCLSTKSNIHLELHSVFFSLLFWYDSNKVESYFTSSSFWASEEPSSMDKMEISSVRELTSQSSETHDSVSDCCWRLQFMMLAANISIIFWYTCYHCLNIQPD